MTGPHDNFFFVSHHWLMYYIVEVQYSLTKQNVCKFLHQSFFKMKLLQNKRFYFILQNRLQNFKFHYNFRLRIWVKSVLCRVYTNVRKQLSYPLSVSHCCHLLMFWIRHCVLLSINYQGLFIKLYRIVVIDYGFSVYISMNIFNLKKNDSERLLISYTVLVFCYQRLVYNLVLFIYNKLKVPHSNNNGRSRLYCYIFTIHFIDHIIIHRFVWPIKIKCLLLFCIFTIHLILKTMTMRMKNTFLLLDYDCISTL